MDLCSDILCSITREPFAIGVAWPSNDVSPTGEYYEPLEPYSSIHSFVSPDVIASHNHLFTCGLNEGGKCRIFSLSDHMIPTSIPSLKSLKEARVVRVLNDGDELPKEAKQLTWLTLYIRETLGNKFDV